MKNWMYTSQVEISYNMQFVSLHQLSKWERESSSWFFEDHGTKWLWYCLSFWGSWYQMVIVLVVILYVVSYGSRQINGQSVWDWRKMLGRQYYVLISVWSRLERWAVPKFDIARGWTNSTINQHCAHWVWKLHQLYTCILPWDWNLMS